MKARPPRIYLPPDRGAATRKPRRFRMVVAYDGTAYGGWQVQPNNTSVQAELEQAIEQLTGERPRVHSSGRTDTGVHALGQVAHFDLHRRVDTGKFQVGLNALLPDDIRVLRLTRTRTDFHARYDATGKEYRYFIWNAPVLRPDLRQYRAHERRPLDVAAMREAAARLVGKHDFAAFSANPHREINGTVRTLTALEVRRRGNELMIVARGDGFLYRMVRSLAGFLIRVGRGEVTPATATEILHSKVRTARVPTAPPQGLFLWRVMHGRTSGARKPMSMKLTKGN